MKSNGVRPYQHSNRPMSPTDVAARPVPSYRLAESRIAEHEARNLMDSLTGLPKSERQAVRAEARALYAKAADLRDQPGDSDPDADELLKRVRNPRSNPALRLEMDLAYVLKDRQVADAARREIAEYAGVAA